MTGKVVVVRDDRGFAFLRRDGATRGTRDDFAHVTQFSLVDDQFFDRSLIGKRVSYDLRFNERDQREQAVNVRLLD